MNVIRWLREVFSRSDHFDVCRQPSDGLRAVAYYHPITYNRFTYMHRPLKSADFHILLALADGPRHGYGIMKEVELESSGDVRLEIGSLYRLLSRLADAGLIEDADGDERRRFYRI